MHKAKTPPFAEKGGVFLRLILVSMSSLLYKTVKKYYLFYIVIVVTNKICSGL